MRSYREARRTKAKELLGGKCAYCGSRDHLQFDHIDPKTKTNNPMSMLQSKEAKFYAEVLKCQLLCATCHLEKTRSESKAREPWHKGKKLTAYRHGNAVGYATDGCRCEICRSWKKTQRKRAGAS